MFYLAQFPGLFLFFKSQFQSVFVISPYIKYFFSSYQLKGLVTVAQTVNSQLRYLKEDPKYSYLQNLCIFQAVNLFLQGDEDLSKVFHHLELLQHYIHREQGYKLLE